MPEPRFYRFKGLQKPPTRAEKMAALPVAYVRAESHADNRQRRDTALYQDEACTQEIARILFWQAPIPPRAQRYTANGVTYRLVRVTPCPPLPQDASERRKRTSP